MARRPVMNQSKKLELSKETLRCLDDQDLTDVVGGGGNREGGGGQEQSVALVCISNADNSCVCIQF
jgi:natural product precursor